jgi:hypothetical protein
MSLAINPRAVVTVLLADGWHPVLDQSFDIDSYEFVVPHSGKVETEDVLHGGGQSDICASGFVFHAEGGTRIAGPLTSILAVEYETET